MSDKTREEHMNWCKQRARMYLDSGSASEAIASMLSDLGKHQETKGVLDAMAPMGLFFAMSNDLEGARSFIEGFN